jgi:hypothetical protein
VVLLAIWFIKSNSAAKFNEIKGKKETICRSFSNFLWETGTEGGVEDESSDENQEAENDS